MNLTVILGYAAFVILWAFLLWHDTRGDLMALVEATREANGLLPRDSQEPRERLWCRCPSCLDELIEIELRAGMAALDEHLKDAL